MKRRLFSLLLCGAMLLSMCPTGLAAEPEAGGLCPHHTEHSYEVCGYVEAAEEVPCNMNCAETGGDGQIIHAEGCAYTPAVEGHPCGYVCRVCPVQAMIDALPDAEGITPDNRAGVEAQLAVIDGARAELTDEEIAALDIAHYAAAVSALAALDGQAGADVPSVTKDNVNYLDASGNQQTQSSVTEITSSTTTWNTGWYVASGTVTIGQRVSVSGTVNLVLEDGCNLTVNGGIQVQDDDSDITNGSANALTIYAQSYDENTMGKLNADGGNTLNAGIGGSSHQAGGTITINGGHITVKGGQNSGYGYGAAGIGGGSGNPGASGGNTTINNGIIDVTGGGDSAAIGGGRGGDGGKITINGGFVTAKTTYGYTAGAAIGSGGDNGNFNVTITGGTVNAYGVKSGAVYAPAIGGGSYAKTNNVGTILISGGNVYAAGDGDVSIGAARGGDASSKVSITISGGTVEANKAIGTASNTTATFSTSENGNAFIIAPSISDNDDTTGWSGVIFQGDAGSVYGSPTLKEDATIPSGKTLTIENGKTLTIDSGVTLTNNGTIKIDSGGKLDNNGTLAGNGTFTGDGEITGSKANQTAPGTGEGYTIDYPAETITANNGFEVSSSNSGVQSITGPIPGQTLYVRRAESNFYNASGWTSFTVADRPAAPNLSIDNAAEGVTISSQYCYSATSADYNGSWTTGNGSIVTVAPGANIYICTPATNSTFRSAVQTLTAPSRGTMPNVSINYANETLSTTTAMQYGLATSGQGVQKWEGCTENMAITSFGWNGSQAVTVQFRTAATGSAYASEVQGPLTIPARPAAPTGLQGVNTSFAGESDGKITGLTSGTAYQISSDGGANWTDATLTGNGEITSLAAGGYSVRVKAAENTSFASEAASVTVGSGDERTYTLNVTALTFDAVTYGYTQPDAKAITITNSGNSDATISSVTVSGGDFTIGGSGSTVTAGDKLESYTVQPKDGLSAGEHTATITVTYDNNATAEATVSIHVNGVPQDAPAAAPVEKSKTYNSVTLEAVSANANGAAAQYSKDNRQTWQDSPEFTGLSPSTKYSFVVRYGASGNYEASPASSALEVTTEAAPVTMYSVTVNGGTGGGSYAAGNTVTITATVPSGQRFTGWTVNAGGVTLANASSATTTFTMPAQAVTVTANFQSNSGGGSSGGGSYTPPTYTPDVSKPSGGGGGTPSVSPSNPKQGDTVTVTPKPDSGYEVDKITVTDRNGKPVEVTKKPDGTYTFRQPNGRVTIEIEYAPVPLIDQPWNSPFSDVAVGDWYYEAVRFVHERGLMNGYSDGRFGPNDPLSRAQLAQILFNKEGRPGVNYLMDFSDVSGEAWYTEAIRWATSQGIVGGYGNGRFGPNDPITREQLAVMLWRYSGSPAATNKELCFSDTDEISGFALEAMLWAVENGILNGYGDGRLGPQGQATRAQVAQMLKNFIENQEENT